MLTQPSRRSVLTLMAGSATAGSLGFGAQAQPAGSGSITIYNAQHASLTKEWAEAFTKETGIATVIRNGNDVELGNQIVQEGAASPADLLLTENSPAAALVARANLFAPLPQPILDQVDPEYRPASGRWIGIAARSTVFAYNKTRLTQAQLPASLMDLAGPGWKGKWGAAPAGADFQAIVSAILEQKGDAETLSWLKGMKANVVPFRSNSIALKAVNAGEVDGAVIYHYYYVGDARRTGENSGNSALHYFGRKDPGAFVSISAAGVLASSRNKDAALTFVKWVSGKGGQAILRDGNSYEYAVGKGQDSNAALVPLAKLDAPAVDPEKLNSRRVTELMTEAGLI